MELTHSCDHALTAETFLAHAALLCRQRGARLTDLRRRVLEIIWSSPTPLGAYAILAVLRDEGRQGAPPTVYRALDFLLAQGLIHRMNSRNVFTACRQPDHHHSGQFLICRDCGQVNELNSPIIETKLRAAAMAWRFEVLAQVVEVLGLCPNCQQGTSSRVG